jgi:hypothetical protein
VHFLQAAQTQECQTSDDSNRINCTAKAQQNVRAENTAAVPAVVLAFHKAELHAALVAPGSVSNAGREGVRERAGEDLLRNLRIVHPVRGLARSNQTPLHAPQRSAQDKREGER